MGGLFLDRLRVRILKTGLSTYLSESEIIHFSLHMQGTIPCDLWCFAHHY